MGEEQGLMFRLNDHGQGPEIIRQVFLERGWIEFEEDTQDESDWNLWWRTTRFRNSDYDQLMPWQRLNHYPRATAITKKDSLVRNLRRMRGIYGANVYNFSPLAFNLPNDYRKFVAEYTRLREKEPDQPLYWICKPADLSRGRGIFVFQDLGSLQYDCNAVVQRYVSNPLLISGYKFDLRIYVLVPNFHPLHVYIYQEGLVRFSTEKFDLNNLTNIFSHLTNTSINKHSPSYAADKERIGPGCKWTLTQLRYYFRQNHMDDQLIWARIQNIVILTLIIQSAQVPKVSNCFELYGFDILIDENLKPWLLEVNFSPAMSADCPTDFMTKKPMLHDLIDMLNFTEEDMERGGKMFTKTHRNPTDHTNASARQSSPNRQGRYTTFSKLPDIMAGSASSLLSVANTHRSSTTVSTAHGEAESEQETIVPIVPGCGLPSVQQTHQKHRQRSSSSSGRSSASSSYSCQQNRKGQTSQDSIVRQSNSNLPVSLKRREAQDVPTSARKVQSVDMRRSLVGNQRESKVSLQSDSAISSYSCSSDSSDNAANIENRWNKTLHQNTKRAKESSNFLNSSSEMSGITNLGVNPSYTEDDQMELADSNSVSDTCEKSNRKKSHISFTANPIAKKSSLLKRSGSLIGGTGGTHKRSTYAKPWRRSKTATTATRKPTNKKPLQSVGDFILVFPFNEVTRKCCATNVDPRIVIRECQKLVKERAAEINTNKKKSDASKNTKPKNQVADTLTLWGPVKPLQESTGH